LRFFAVVTVCLAFPAISKCYLGHPNWRYLIAVFMWACHYKYCKCFYFRWL